MSNGVLPARRGRAVVREVVHDPPVDVFYGKQFVRSGLNGHEDERSEGVGRLGVHVYLGVVGYRWDDGVSLTVVSESSGGTLVPGLVGGTGGLLFISRDQVQQVAPLQPIQVGEVVVVQVALGQRGSTDRGFEHHGLYLTTRTAGEEWYCSQEYEGSEMREKREERREER